MVELRRETSQEPWAHALNRVIDTLLGNTGGRITLIDDDGVFRNTVGGATLGTDEPSFKVRSGSGEHVLVQHSNGVDTLLEVQDDGVTAPIVKNAVAFEATLTVKNGPAGATVLLVDPPNNQVSVGTATGKLGLFGATPVVRPAAYTLSYTSTSRTLASYPNSSYSGIATGQAGSPYAQVSDLNDLRQFVQSIGAVVHQLLTDLKGYGAVQ